MMPFFRKEKSGQGDVREIYLLWGWMVYVRVGQVSSFALFGRNIYRRVGSIRMFLNFKWEGKQHA